MCIRDTHFGLGGDWGAIGGGGRSSFGMPASEAASATYQRNHWPRTYGALVSCGTVFSEIDAKINDLLINSKSELSFYQRHYLRNAAMPWCNVVRYALKRHLRISHGFLVHGLKIIEGINNIYASIELRLSQHEVKHRHLCVCHLCFVEIDS